MDFNELFEKFGIKESHVKEALISFVKEEDVTLDENLGNDPRVQQFVEEYYAQQFAPLQSIMLEGDELKQKQKDSLTELMEDKEPGESVTLSRHDFVAKIVKEEKGNELLDLLDDGETKVCMRLGMLEWKDDLIHVPDWKRLVSHLQICNSVFE